MVYDHVEKPLSINDDDIFFRTEGGVFPLLIIAADATSQG